MFVLQNKVYVFRFEKYWVFEYNEANSEQPFGPLIDGNLEIESQWKGIDGNKNRFTVNDNKIVSIGDKKITKLEPNGKITKTEEIDEENVDDEEDWVIFTLGYSSFSILFINFCYSYRSQMKVNLSTSLL